MKIIEIIENILFTAIMREEIVIKLLELDVTIHEYKFTKAIAELVKKLLRVFTFLYRYIDPFLCCIFDKPDTGNICFGEANPAHQGSNHYTICRDLLRVLIFCKDALDTQNITNVMGLHIIDRTMSLYIFVLPSSDLYGMYKLSGIKFPNCLNDSPNLVTRYHPTIINSMCNQFFPIYQSCKSPCLLKQ
ncbi:hypothetical protein J3Q64DRAFT_1808324 [Phycomyces blakesleeanus]|uniref:Uncharacterized protein n=1 Tax=Phycomyces blakesleeanus TaxID=4837 RepID=A0ABR3B6G9_PHYBL